MKKFKEFIGKPEEYISNSHGQHASIDSCCVEEYYISEALDSSDKFDNYINTNDNAKHLGFDTTNHEEGEHSKQMDFLHSTHLPNTKEGKRSIYQFTSGSRAFTEGLLNHRIFKKPLNPEHSQLDQSLKEHAFQPLRHDLHTYSGVGYDIKNVKPVGKSVKGKPVYNQPTYMSSSLRKRVALRFAGKSASERDEPNKLHMFHWHNEQGQQAGIVGKDSRFKHEHEVLLPTTSHDNHYIELLKSEQHKDSQGRTINVHHVRRIPESKVRMTKKEKEKE